MCDCDHDNQSSSGFILGLFIGAIISALVAIYIYKNNKTDIFVKLKATLEKYFKALSKTPPTTPNKSKKITVTLPEKVSEKPPQKSVNSVKPRKFVKK